jgi:hypothetical protein
MSKQQSSADSAQPPWWKILADNWRGRKGNTTTGDSVRNSCADELEKVAAKYLATEPQAARADIEDIADIIRDKAYADENDKIGGVHDAAQKIVEYLTTLPARCQAVCAPQIVGTGVPPSLPLGWNDQHAAKAAWMINTLAISPPDEWLSKAELYETLGEFRALTRPPHNRVEKTNGSQS